MFTLSSRYWPLKWKIISICFECDISVCHRKAPSSFFAACFAEMSSLIFSKKSIISAGSCIFLVLKRLHHAPKIAQIITVVAKLQNKKLQRKNQAFIKPEHDQVYATVIKEFCLELSFNIFNPYGKLSNVYIITCCSVFTRLNLHPF